jgi:DNA-binding transcriptional LysR family regulator
MAISLEKIDTNLLIALDVLLEERSVTKAAARMYVTQPAMSQSLRKLRDILNDALLVREKGRMELTPRALYLQAPLRLALSQLRAALEGEPRFEPAKATTRFRIASLDSSMITLLPSLIASLQREAPSITVEVLAIPPHRVFDALEAGEVEMGLGVFPLPPDHIGYQKLLDERFLSLTRREHPLSKKKEIDLDEFLAYPHALISTTGQGEGAVDRSLRLLGRTRHIALRVPYFMSIPALVQDTDLLVTMPAQNILCLAQYYPLFVFEPPLAVEGFPISMVWPRRLDDAPAHRWLRELVTAIQWMPSKAL